MDKFQRKEVLYGLWDQWLHGSDKGRAAKAIFPNIRGRLKCKWIDLTSDTIRILSEHGPFGTYLHDRTLSQHPNCLTDGLRDDPNHVVFDWFDVLDTVCDIRRQVESRSLSEAVKSGSDWITVWGLSASDWGQRACVPPPAADSVRHEMMAYTMIYGQLCPQGSGESIQNGTEPHYP